MPHSIKEVAAFVMAVGLGFCLGVCVTVFLVLFVGRLD